MSVTGVILAGGKSSRMGEDKGLLTLSGKSMVEHVMEALSPVVSSVIIISNNKEYEKFGVPVYSDLIKDKGPVGGIYTGLYHSNTDKNLCVSCDVPLVSTEFFKWLLAQSENQVVTVPKYKGKTHQLIGVYSKIALKKYKESLDKNLLRLKDVNQDLGCKIVDAENSDVRFDELIFSNINTKNELKHIEYER